MTKTPDLRAAASGIRDAEDVSENHALPKVADVLAVCAHPDDESFGLGAVLAAFAAQGTRVRVLCFTRGEASTLGETAEALAVVRAQELSAAAEVLGVDRVSLLAHADGRLGEVAPEQLAHAIETAAADADLLLVFDEGGITGHPDHCRVTEAAVLVGGRCHLPVLAWALPEDVASRLNAEFGATFVGRPMAELSIALAVDRTQQHEAIACHASQARDNPVLWRRLELLGSLEHLRWLT